jgi:biotin-independent malonate decarboxylase gamma subunit
VRGSIWARALLEGPCDAGGFPPSVVVCDGTIGGRPYRTVAVVPNRGARFPRARNGEFGLDEGLAVARAVRGAPPGAALISVVDVPGQAFGRREEAAGISLALAASVAAYIDERRRGRSLFTLVVGKAISGAFLAHGMQSGWIGALNDREVEVHVMPAASVARVTRSSAAEVARVATVVPATARDIATFASFGAVDDIFEVVDANAPAPDEIEAIRAAIDRAREAGLGIRAPLERLERPEAARRALARDVRARIDKAW